jgi:hypothetical protein
MASRARSVGGHHDDGGPGQASHELGEQIHPADPRHPDVAEDDLEGGALHRAQGLPGARRADRLVALGAQNQLKALPKGVVVVNDEDPIRHVRRATSDVWSIGVRGFDRVGFRRPFRSWLRSIAGLFPVREAEQRHQEAASRQLKSS